MSETRVHPRRRDDGSPEDFLYGFALFAGTSLLFGAAAMFILVFPALMVVLIGGWLGVGLAAGVLLAGVVFGWLGLMAFGDLRYFHFGGD